MNGAFQLFFRAELSLPVDTCSKGAAVYFLSSVSPAGYSVSVFHLWPLEPDMRARLHHRPLDDPHQASVDLTHLSDREHTAVTSSHQNIWNKRHIDPAVGDTHHGVAAVIGQNHNIDGRGVIGYTDSSFLRLIFSVERGRHVKWFLVSSSCCVKHDNGDELKNVKKWKSICTHWTVTDLLW